MIVRWISAGALLLSSASVWAISPYIQGDAVPGGTVQAAAAAVEARLKTGGFKVIGKYFPPDLAGYGVVIATDHAMLEEVGAVGGHTKLQSVVGNTALDIVAIVGTALLAETIEQVGRLRAQVIGFAGSVIGLLLVWVFALHGPPPLAVLITGLTLWQVAISYGPSNTCWVFPVELYPTDLRASAHGLATAVSRAGALIAVFLLPLMQAAIGVIWLMLVFAVIGILGAVLSAWLGEETAGKPLLQDAVASDASLATAARKTEI